MKLTYFFILLIFLNGCSKVRESAGVTRQSIDEYKVVENPPLVIPPEFDLIPPDQLVEKNIEDIDNDFAKEILFGLDQDQIQKEESDSLVDIILEEVKAFEVSETIREEIDEGIAKEINTKDLNLDNWEDEVQVLDAIKESECIRNENFEKGSILNCKNSFITEAVKKKKKKKFIFF